MADYTSGNTGAVIDAAVDGFEALMGAGYTGSFIISGSGAIGGGLAVAGAASSSIISAAETGGGDVVSLTALTAGNGVVMASLDATLADYEPLRLIGEDLTFETRSGVGTSASRMVISASTGHVLAGADNAQTLGGASNRWSTVYAGTGTINTSDAREKTPVRSLSAAETAAAVALSKEVGIYQWLASVESKGDAARQHVGMTVQRAIEIMEAQGLDPLSYGFICYDAWDDEFVDHPAVDATDEAPAVAAWTEQTKVAGDRYGFRPDQLNSFIAAGINARLEALEA